MSDVNTKAATDYLVASGAIAVSIIETDGVCSCRVGVTQEGSPSLVWRPASFDHVPSSSSGSTAETWSGSMSQQTRRPSGLRVN
jgi:hypothetical protein